MPFLGGMIKRGREEGTLTILEACLEVLGSAADPMTAEQIIAQIHDERSATQPKVREVGKGSYARVW